MLNGGRARYPRLVQALLAGLLVVMLAAGRGRPAAAQDTYTNLSACQAVARYDSRTILITWRTTQERTNDQLILSSTIDNGANWTILDTFYADGVAKSYSYMDGWQADGTVIGYKVAARNPTTLVIGINVVCLVQIEALTVTPSVTPTFTATSPAPTHTPTPTTSRTATSLVSPVPTSSLTPAANASSTAIPVVQATATMTPATPVAGPGPAVRNTPPPPPAPLAATATATVRPVTPTRTPTGVLRRLPASLVTPAADILPVGTQALPAALPPAETSAVALWPSPGLLVGLAATLLALAALAGITSFWLWRRGVSTRPAEPGPGGDHPAGEGGAPVA